MRRAITRTPLITANLVQDSVLPVSGLDRETTVDRAAARWSGVASSRWRVR